MPVHALQSLLAYVYGVMFFLILGNYNKDVFSLFDGINPLKYITCVNVSDSTSTHI